jgi:D-amino-acid dehydrogenase
LSRFDPSVPDERAGKAEPDVIVIGAGVVGLSAAIAALARGLSVMVLDREGPAAGASAGNAGAFAFTDILPLASPGILKKAPKWLLDPLGPLTVPPAYALQIAPWMFRFWRACSPRRVAHSTAAQTALMDLSKAELEPFLATTGTLPMLRKDGNLQVYESEAELKASLPGWTARQEHGIAFRHLDAAGMAEIQPGLAPRFTHGTFTPGWYSIADPKLYTWALADHFRARGGVIGRADVVALRPVDGGVEVQTLGGTTLRAAQVVVAAGAFSHRLSKTVGDVVPLETERGYNTTLPLDAFDLRVQVTFGGHGFVVTRLSTGIRVGGAVELGGLKLPPNFRRSDAMLQKAQMFLPGLRSEGGAQWMGFRPSLPDSLPAIGRAGATPRVIYAFGHGHLGLTQSAGTARIVADLLTGKTPAIHLTPFSPQRF